MRVSAGEVSQYEEHGNQAERRQDSHRLRCIIRNFENILSSRSGFCYEYAKLSCLRVGETGDFEALKT